MNDCPSKDYCMMLKMSKMTPRFLEQLLSDEHRGRIWTPDQMLPCGPLSNNTVDDCLCLASVRSCLKLSMGFLLRTQLAAAVHPG
jgi:hypothetical protein